MIPVLFKKNEQQFKTYGLGEITDIINPKVTRERNGQYLLYFQYPQNAEFSEIFEEDMRIKSDAGVRTKWQTFEISRVVRKEGQLIEVFAKHISQSLLKDALNPNINIRSSSAQQALRTWNSNRIGDEEFDVWSDISTTSSTSWNIQDVSNAFEALAGVQGSILDVWGGEYEFDNKMIRLHKEMGRKSPVPLEYGRNITGLEQDKQEDNVYTSIYPFAIYTPESGDDPKTVTLPERYIDGKYLEMHNKRKIQVVDFSGEFEHDEVPTASRLKTLAKQYLEANEIGLPHENLKVEYIDLSKTLDYQDFKTMEEVELNDRLPIFYPKFGITNENAKVVIINYDPVKEENISIELGVIGQTFKTITTGGIDSRLDKVEQQQKETTNYIINAKGNRIWFETPDENMEHKIGDTWFEKKGPYDRIRVWNGSQWETIIDSEDIDKNAKAIEAAQADIAQVQQTADEAVNRINGEIAGKFTDIDTEISQVHNDAQKALNQAGEAVSQVVYFDERLDGFTQTVANIDGRVANIRHDVDGITQTVTDHTGKIATVEHNVNGIQETVSDPVNGLVTQVSTLASGFNVLAKDFENMEIGGRNLYINDESSIDRTGAGTYVFNHTETPYGFYAVGDQARTNKIKIKDVVTGDGFYTVSFDLRGSQNGGGAVSVNICDQGQQTIKTPSDNDWGRFSLTVNVTNYDAESGVNYVEFIPTWSHIWVDKIKIERGTVATDWTPAPEDMATQAQLSVLNDNINLRVEKGDVINQINISDENILIQANKIMALGDVVVDGKLTITDEFIAPNAQIDGAKIADATIGSAKIVSLDVDKISGNRTEFVQSAWNNVVGGIEISGNAITGNKGSTNRFELRNDGSLRNNYTSGSINRSAIMNSGFFQAYKDGGQLFLLGNEPHDRSLRDSTLGVLGVTARTEFRIGRYDRASTDSNIKFVPYIRLAFSGGSTEESAGRLVFDKTWLSNGNGDMRGNRLEGLSRIDFEYGNNIQRSTDGSGRMQFMTTSTFDFRSGLSGSTLAMRLSSTHMLLHRTLSMEGHYITNAAGYRVRSERKYKSNIIPLENAMKTIEQMNFYEYEKGGVQELGIITDEAPEIILSQDKKTVDIYSYTSLIGKSNQELIKRVKELETEVAELKGMIA